MEENKKLVIEKKESKSLPIDPDNTLIIIPKNVEVQMLCTNVTQNFEELEKREQKREELRKKQEERKNKPNPFERKNFQQLKKRVVKAPPPINRTKVIDNITKLKRAIAGLEKEISDLTKIDNKSDDKKKKELEEIQHLNGLVERWKSACQEGIIELQKQLSETYPDMSMNKIVDLLKVDPKEIGYDPETQDFI